RAATVKAALHSPQATDAITGPATKLPSPTTVPTQRANPSVRLPSCLPERVEQFSIEGIVTRELEPRLPLVPERCPRRVVTGTTLTDTARVPRHDALLRGVRQRQELRTVLVVPLPPRSGALLQVNEPLLACHVDVFDALASHSHDTSTGHANPDNLTLRTVHSRSSDGCTPACPSGGSRS